MDDGQADQILDQPGATGPSSTALGQSLFEDALERFIQPELERRLAAGRWNPADGIFAFQILLHDDGLGEIRLNDQIGGMLEAIAGRPVEAGETVGTDDIAGISEYVPREVDRGVPHITAFAHAGGWSVAFEFTGGHPKRHDFLVRAGEFADTASEALDSSRLGAFVDNAFSATELLVRAELLSCRPTVELVLDTKDHGVVAATYKKWGDLGNTDRRFPRLLKRLSKLRPRGRYLDDDLDLSFDDAQEILVGLREMQRHVARLVQRDDVPDRFSVYAARDLRAGELVGPSDYTLAPRKRQRSHK